MTCSRAADYRLLQCREWALACTSLHMLEMAAAYSVWGKTQNMQEHEEETLKQLAGKRPALGLLLLGTNSGSD